MDALGHDSGDAVSTTWRSMPTITLAVCSTIGLIVFFAPLLVPFGTRGEVESASQAALAPYLFALITALCLFAMMMTVAEDHGGVARSKTVALLGVLIAVDATLRLVPGVLGASPIFLLIMLVGAVFGSSIGFQMGALTLLFSAFITGGVGPWLPFQMLACGWIGLSAGWLPKPELPRLRIAILAAFGAVWGLAFGVLMNLWFWPFSAPGVDLDAALYWSPGMTPLEAVTRYGRFYLVTSLGFDMFRAIGNVVLVLVIGGPILRLLERYRSRFSWQPWVDLPADADDATTKPPAFGA